MSDATWMFSIILLTVAPAIALVGGVALVAVIAKSATVNLPPPDAQGVITLHARLCPVAQDPKFTHPERSQFGVLHLAPHELAFVAPNGQVSRTPYPSIHVTHRFGGIVDFPRISMDIAGAGSWYLTTSTSRVSRIRNSLDLSRRRRIDREVVQLLASRGAVVEPGVLA